MLPWCLTNPTQHKVSKILSNFSKGVLIFSNMKYLYLNCQINIYGLNAKFVFPWQYSTSAINGPFLQAITNKAITNVILSISISSSSTFFQANRCLRIMKNELRYESVFFAKQGHFYFHISFSSFIFSQAYWWIWSREKWGHWLMNKKHLRYMHFLSFTNKIIRTNKN